MEEVEQNSIVFESWEIPVDLETLHNKYLDQEIAKLNQEFKISNRLLDISIHELENCKKKSLSEEKLLADLRQELADINFERDKALRDAFGNENNDKEIQMLCDKYKILEDVLVATKIEYAEVQQKLDDYRDELKICTKIDQSNEQTLQLLIRQTDNANQPY